IECSLTKPYLYIGRKEEERIFLNCLPRFPRAVEEILSINMPPQDHAPVKDTDLGPM
ncbi:unnamed protein product, partial [Musa textilis]